MCIKGTGDIDLVRIVCYFRYLNRYTISDSYPDVDSQKIIHRIYQSNSIITSNLIVLRVIGNQKFVLKVVGKQDSFFDNELHECNRTDFSLKSGGCILQ